MSLRARYGWLFLGVLAWWAFPPAAPGGEDPTPARMQDIAHALEAVFPLSVSAARFAAPENKAAVAEALDALASDSRQIELHGTGGPAGFDLLAGSMAAEARSALARFESGDPGVARHAVQRLTGFCFACHSRAPAESLPGLTAPLFEDPAIASLPARDRLTLAVVVRRFDTALSLGEEILANPDILPAEADQTGALSGYLAVCVRVERDPHRALATLRRFRARADLPSYLVPYVEAWIHSLDTVPLEPGPDGVIETAHDLIAQGQAANRYPADRMGLIPFLAASGMLNRFVMEPAAPPGKVPLEDVAEAYYLLGVTECGISRVPWPPETELYLETAIRIDPQAPSAENAYLLLEETVTTNYTGSAGTEIPPDAAKRLEELKRLVEGH